METKVTKKNKQYLEGKTTGIILASLLGVFILFILWKFKKFPYQE